MFCKVNNSLPSSLIVFHRQDTPVQTITLILSFYFLTVLNIILYFRRSNHACRGSALQKSGKNPVWKKGKNKIYISFYYSSFLINFFFLALTYNLNQSSYIISSLWIFILCSKIYLQMFYLEISWPTSHIWQNRIKREINSDTVSSDTRTSNWKVYTIYIHHYILIQFVN